MCIRDRFAIPAFLVLSFVFNLELTSILAAGGIVFAAIALSLQSSLSDLIKGIFVNIERPFAINDWITVDDKTGYVENITWRSTRIRTFQNTEVIIPNEIVADSILTNWSKQDKEKMSEGFNFFNKLYFHPSHDPENISKLLENLPIKITLLTGKDKGKTGDAPGTIDGLPIRGGVRTDITIEDTYGNELKLDDGLYVNRVRDVDPGTQTDVYFLDFAFGAAFFAFGAASIFDVCPDCAAPQRDFFANDATSASHKNHKKQFAPDLKPIPFDQFRQK